LKIGLDILVIYCAKFKRIRNGKLTASITKKKKSDSACKKVSYWKHIKRRG
jgi:hypothetical protein